MKAITKLLFSVTVAGSCLSAHAAPDYAFFDAATGQLRMDDLIVDESLKVRKAVIQLTDPGSIREWDRSITSERLTFTSSANVLRIPRLVLKGVIYNQVNLTNPSFTLVSYESAVAGVFPAPTPVVPPAPTTNTLEIRVTVQGSAIPLITIKNVPRPSNQNDFCNNPELHQTILQNTGGYTVSWTMTGCTFSGVSGRMEGLLTILDPVSATYPAVANFTFK